MKKLIIAAIAVFTLFAAAACAAPAASSGAMASSAAASSGAMAPSAAASSGAMAPSAAETGAAYHKITAKEAKARMDSGDKLTIVDVRTESEYAEGHIKNAINVPNESITSAPPAALPDKNAEILVYCRSGHRSRLASEKLVAMGYTAVYDMGGIIDWPYEVVK